MSFREYIPFYRRNLKVAVPIVLSQLGGALVQLVDTFMVGRLGTAELAAASFASALFVIGFVFSNGIIMGSTPLVGRSYMRNERDRVVRLFQNSILLSAAAGIVMMCFLGALRLVMPYMGQETHVVELAIPYYTTLVFSIFPYLIFLSFKQFLEGLGNTSVAMIITITANLVNILFNYFLIYGKCGFPALGVTGAGVATLLSRVLMPILFIIVIRFRKDWWAYCRSFIRTNFSWATVRELLSVGVPIASHMLLEVSAFALSSIMVGWLGAASLAGNQIAQNMSHMLFMVVSGIAAATTIRVSHQYGMRDYRALRMASTASIHLCLVANAIMGALLIIFRVEVASLFSSDPEVIDIGSHLLIMSGIFQLSDGLQAVGAGTLRGLADVKITMVYAFIAYICINLPLGYILAFPLGFGALGVWAAFIFGLTVSAVLFRLRCLKNFRRLKTELVGDTRP